MTSLRSTLTFNGDNSIPKLLMDGCVWAPRFPLPTKRAMKQTAKKTTENRRERGDDQRATGSHSVNNPLISSVKACVHTWYVESLCANLVRMGFDQARVCKKMRGFDFARKIRESEKGKYSRQTHLSYIAWPLKYVDITYFMPSHSSPVLSDPSLPISITSSP